jgi:aspartyl-tRNA(Asn)/glutamyl-tRNA(Gln) amidotransferase subunit C
MAISAADVRHVAALCRLAIPREQEATVAESLGRILEHVQRLQTCDVTGVPPTSHVGELGETLREDEVCPSLPPEVATANAFATRSGLFLVPRVVDDAADPGARPA